MDSSPNLNLPYIAPAQAQKHVTHNEALRALDALVHLSVLRDDLTTPPSTPADGDRYIIGSSASAAWAGQDGKVGAYQDGAWAFYQPATGWRAWVEESSALVVWDGMQWSSVGTGGGGPASVNPTPLVGVNATADTTNRLSVASPAALLNHEGNGHQLKINKNAAGDTASLLYQTGFSGRAEFGTTGDDDFHVKVSPDGSTFHEAIVVDKDTGAVSLPNTTPAFTPFASRAKGIQTTATAIPTATTTVIDFDTEDFDTDGYLDIGTDSERFTIPAGVSSVLLHGYLQVTSAVGTTNYILVEHFNSSDVRQAFTLLPLIVNYAGFATGLFAVSQGDYFTMSLYQNSGSDADLHTDGRNYMSISAVA